MGHFGPEKRALFSFKKKGGGQMPSLPPGSAAREGETDLGPTWDICKPSRGLRRPTEADLRRRGLRVDNNNKFSRQFLQVTFERGPPLEAHQGVMTDRRHSLIKKKRQTI